MNKSYWFYIDPYVHISLKKNHALLYNTLDGSALEVTEKPRVLALLKRLKSWENMYVVKLFSADLVDPNISTFVRDVRRLLMGDLVDTHHIKGKPVQIMPEPKIMESPPQVATGDEEVWGKDVMTRLLEMSFYINSAGKAAAPLNNHAYKQFLFPSPTSAAKKELPLEHIKTALDQARSSNLLKVNILGDSIFHYSRLKELTAFLNSLTIQKTYAFFYEDLRDEKNDLKLADTFRECLPGEKENLELKIFVTFPLQEAILGRAAALQEESGIKTNFCFVLESGQDFDAAEQAVSRFALDHHSFFPYYNGSNLDFFKEAIYFTREEIFAAKPTQRELLRRTLINEIKFGKLTVLANGAVYADVNKPRLGMLGRDTLPALVYKEIVQGKSWQQVRAKQKTCRSCVFQYLCPPPSTYEQALGRYDICFIYPG